MSKPEHGDKPSIACPHDQSLVAGIGRDPNNRRFIDIALRREITDDEMRDLHEYLRGWRPSPETGEGAG